MSLEQKIIYLVHFSCIEPIPVVNQEEFQKKKNYRTNSITSCLGALVDP